MPEVKKLRVCWFGIYNPDYTRNDVLISGLRKNGVTVVECRTDPMTRFKHLKLIRDLVRARGSYDVVYVAYPSPSVALWAKVFSGKKIFVDAFYSMYEAVVYDRKEVSRFHPRALKLLLLDWISILAADIVVTDTEEHKKYWQRWLMVRPLKIHAIYIGINDEKIWPHEHAIRKRFLVHFHGTYIPLQGTEKIVEAARLLQSDQSIRFRMVGTGQDYTRCIRRIDELGLQNIELVGRVKYFELNDLLNDSDVVLGIFGDTEKARRVIPNKVYEGLAARKPVITMDTPAVRELFSDNDLILVSGTAESIARAILDIKTDNVRTIRLAQSGHKKVAEYYPIKTGAVLANLMLSVSNVMQIDVNEAHH